MKNKNQYGNYCVTRTTKDIPYSNIKKTILEIESAPLPHQFFLDVYKLLDKYAPEIK